MVKGVWVRFSGTRIVGVKVYFLKLEQIHESFPPAPKQNYSDEELNCKSPNPTLAQENFQAPTPTPIAITRKIRKRFQPGQKTLKMKGMLQMEYNLGRTRSTHYEISHCAGGSAPTGPAQI